MLPKLGPIPRFIFKIIFYGVLIALGAFAAYKLSLILAPFIVAFIISSLIEPFIRLLITKTKLGRKTASAITIVIVLLVFGGAITLILLKLIKEIAIISASLPSYYNTIYTNIESITNKITDIYLGLPSQFSNYINDMISNLLTYLGDILNSILKGILSTASSIPQTAFFTLITLLSTYFISSDRDKLLNLFSKHLPVKWVKAILYIKNEFFSALVGFIKAQMILLTITLIELFILFSCMSIPNAITLSLFIFLTDLLPYLGTGIILFPWATYEFLTYNYKLGIYLLVTYAIVMLVRQLIEPKILSKQIGVYPLLTLMSMYIGLYLFGFMGMFLGPILVLLFGNMFKTLLKGKSLKDFLPISNKPN